MKRPTYTNDQLVEDLRRVAMQYPETEEGLACAGTALEKRTIKVRKKAFLFLGPTNAMIKLCDSLDMATELASREPSRFRVGAHGWVTITFDDVESLPVDLIIKWVDESFRLLAPKQLLAVPSESETTGVLKKTAKPKDRKQSRK